MQAFLSWNVFCVALQNAESCTIQLHPPPRPPVAPGNGRGDVCETDSDGDGVVDRDDVCPDDGRITATDFRAYQTVILDPEGDAQKDPNWVVFNEVLRSY